MNRDQALNLIYRRAPESHRDTDQRGRRCIIERGAVLPIDQFTDEQIVAHLPTEYRTLYHPETAHA